MPLSDIGRQRGSIAARVRGGERGASESKEKEKKRKEREGKEKKEPSQALHGGVGTWGRV
jgi:hypothetical protein